LAAEHRFKKRQNPSEEGQRRIWLIRATRANGVVLLSGDRHLGAIYVAFLPPPVKIPFNLLNRPWRGANKRDAREVSQAIGEENFGTIDID